MGPIYKRVVRIYDYPTTNSNWLVSKCFEIDKPDELIGYTGESEGAINTKPIISCSVLY